MDNDREVNIDNQCPQCGALIREGNVCEYCGARISYEEDEEPEVPMQDQPTPEAYEYDGIPKNNRTMMWWILGWVFIFPVPVMILIWRPKCTWKLPVKITVTVLFWILFFVIQMLRNGNLTTNINVHY